MNLKQNRYLDLKSFPTGRRIKLLCIAAGVRASDLAKSLRINTSTLSYHLSDVTEIPRKHLALIAKRLKVDLGVLSDEQQDQSSSSSHEMY